MPVDPEMMAIIEAMRALNLPRFAESTAAEMRARMDVAVPPTEAVRFVEDAAAPGPAGEIPVRIYRPDQTSTGLIVFFHGGGWTVGNLNSHDGLVRPIANATGCTVVAIDYRLAPENPFPAAVEDAWAAVQWAGAHSKALTGSDDAPLILMGDSAGGNLSTVVSIMARDAAGPAIAQQVLIYPSTLGDIDGEAMFSLNPPLLERSDIAWFYDQYVPRAQRSDWRFAPALAPDLSRLPPAAILTCEYDLLTAESAAYAEKLKAAGNEVSYLCWDGAVHGFLSMAPRGALARRAIGDIAREVGAVTARRSAGAASA